MATVQPVTIQCGTFVCTLCDIGILMRMPLANVRKIWKIMFSAEDENRETIQTIRNWLPVNVTECADRIPQAEAELAARKTTKKPLTAAEKAVRTAKAARVKAQKLQTIFNEMSKN